MALIILRFLIIALVFSVLLLNSKARLFQTSAQVPMQSMQTIPVGFDSERFLQPFPDAPLPASSFCRLIPEYCEVKVTLTPQIQFEVRLPTQNWNRRYLQVGCDMRQFESFTRMYYCTQSKLAVAFDNTGHVAAWARECTLGTTNCGLTSPAIAQSMLRH